MANSNYTGSPLGIIHGEKIRYNDGEVINSIFSSTTKMNRTDGGVLKTKNKNSLSNHTDELYDLSTPYIIEKLKNISALELKYSDFAYLKNYGVYPNNRLVVVRRFETPVPDNLFEVKGMKSPMSTIVGYADNIGDLIKIDVNEGWEESESSLKSLLNDFGKDVMGNVFGEGKGLGDKVMGGMDLIPMSNLTTMLQRRILSDKRIGIISEKDASELPIADPNIIRESKKRKMVGEDSSGSGLDGKFEMTITTEYEQKFINGVDPTIVYMDIINNVLQMGTSRSTFYLGRSDDPANKTRDIINRFSKDPMGELKVWCEVIVESMKNALTELGQTLVNGISKVIDGGGEEENSEDAERKKKEQEKIDADNKIKGVSALLTNIANDILKNIIVKYRHRLLGVITNMTGAPSTPWHVTIGNPLRPVFVSGDMLCKNLTIEPGNILAFNNLPSTIKVTMKLESARNLGLQEIFAKYNAGSIRTTNGTYVATGPKDFNSSNNYIYNKPVDKPIQKSTPKESPQGPELDNNNQNTTTQTTKATTNGREKVNNDANGESLVPATENTGGISNASTTEANQPETSGPNAKTL
jgi:hypothetical protein